jgi:hypothetical protein
VDELRKMREKLTQLHLSTRELTHMLGRLIEGEGQAQSILVQPASVVPVYPQSLVLERMDRVGPEPTENIRQVLTYVREGRSATVAALLEAFGASSDELAERRVRKALRQAIEAGYLVEAEGTRPKCWLLTSAGAEYIEQRQAGRADDSTGAASLKGPKRWVVRTPAGDFSVVDGLERLADHDPLAAQARERYRANRHSISVAREVAASLRRAAGEGKPGGLAVGRSSHRRALPHR